MCVRNSGALVVSSPTVSAYLSHHKLLVEYWHLNIQKCQRIDTFKYNLYICIDIFIMYGEIKTKIL